MSGIHLHPHDILDEPMSQITERLGRLRDIGYVLPEVNTIFERNPVPVGTLPHNPVHDVVYGNGTLHAVLPSYAELGLDQQRAPEVTAEHDPLVIIKNSMAGTEVEVVAWINILNGDFHGERLAENQVIDYAGRPVEHWLCPNGPDVLPFWQHVLHDLYQRYGFTTYMIDRIRYPDWAGTAIDPRQLLTCFCDRCQERMRHKQIDPDAVRSAIEQWTRLITAKRFAEAVDQARSSDVLARWWTLRQDSVARFVDQLIAYAQTLSPDINVWLDLWPPAYGWLLGQDYGRLTALSPAFKHFPYHRLGGGADVQGLIDRLTDTPEEQDAAFAAFLRFFDLPYDLSYSSFKADGFPISFVGEQNDLARRRAAPHTRIFSGIQMWNTTPGLLVDAVRAAERSNADDLLYYCYGWASDDLFDAIQELRDHAPTDDRK